MCLIEEDEEVIIVDITICGNDKVEGDEECDDGNLNDGDGCSQKCINEDPKEDGFFKKLILGLFNIDLRNSKVVEYSLIALLISILLAQIFTFMSQIGGGLSQLVSNFPMILGVVFDRNKRKTGWGIVYDYIENKPIPYAEIELLSAKDNSLIQKTITDLEGRYRFITDEGDYKLNANHHDYEMASSDDFTKGNYDLTGKYLGGVINYKEERSVPFDIPMYKKTYVNLKFYRNILDKVKILVKKLGFVLNIIGGLLIVISLIWFPSTLVYILFLVNMIILAVLLVVSRLYLKDWGVTYLDSRNNRLEGVFIRLFDTKNRKFINSVMTDSKGRYGFIADDSDYLIHAMRAELKMDEELRISVNRKKGKVIKNDIAMHRVFFAEGTSQNEVS